MYSRFRTIALSLALLALSGCATTLEGRMQAITVKSDPEGAQCLIKQADDVVSRVTTPGTGVVNKEKNDLVIYCSKAGYESATIKNKSDLALTSLGNAALYQLSFVGNAIDSMTGASNKYDSDVFVKLIPAAAPAAFPAPPGAPPVIKLGPEIAARMSLQAPIPGQMMAAMPIAAPVVPVGTAALAAPPAPMEHQFISATGPANYAAMSFGKSVARMMNGGIPPEPQAYAYAPQAAPMPAPLSYAQEMADASRRPPFEITQ